MKITKNKLRKIIREELAMDSLALPLELDLDYTMPKEDPRVMGHGGSAKMAKGQLFHIARNAQSLQNGKPIPNNSSDLYINRKKNLAIAQSSTKTKSETTRQIKFKNYNPQDVKNAKQSCRNQGCVPSRKVVNNRVQNTIGCC